MNQLWHAVLVSVLLVMILFTVLAFTTGDHEQVVKREDQLSAYGFFEGKMADLEPVTAVIPYTVNTPLFSNYADKLRFVRFPENSAAIYNDTAAFELPVGTILIKNFYYQHDYRKPEKGRKILETRLLVHQQSGWEAWPYRWNEEQTEAYYDPAAETQSISYVNAAGKKVSLTYAIPNKNQCKGCHSQGLKLVPIGINARQLNGELVYSDGNKHNQLEYWKEHQLLKGLPSETQRIPKLPVWNDPSTGNLNDRARAYLDANCGHCHSRSGPANTSGLYLDFFERDPSHLGINKSPVAAGRGAGDLQFDIVPGQPQHSILLYRMKTNDPAIAMPEIGRELVHMEGVTLIEEWIRKNAF